MQVTKKSRSRIRFQNILFVMLFLGVIGMLAWLSNRYTITGDWTADARNTLSPASIELLRKIDGPLTITAFVRDDAQSSALRKRITQIVGRYQQHHDDKDHKRGAATGRPSRGARALRVADASHGRFPSMSQAGLRSGRSGQRSMVTTPSVTATVGSHRGGIS